MQKLRLGIVLALCMLLVVSAFATETETVTAGVSITAADVTADANGEAVVVITVDSGDTAVAAVLFTVGPENVAVKSVEAVPGAYADESAASGWGFVPQTNNEGKLPMNLAFINAAAQDATLKATVTLTLEGITEDVDLTITGEASAMGTADDENGVAVPVTATGATITVKPACDHTLGEWTLVEGATYERACECGEATETHTHTFSDWAAVEGTNTHSRACADCDVPGNTETAEHNYVKGDLVPATRETDAYYTYTCDGCGDSYDEIVPTQDLTFTFGHNVLLESSYILNFRVPYTVVKDVNGVLAVNGNDKTKVYTWNPEAGEVVHWLEVTRYEHNDDGEIVAVSYESEGTWNESRFDFPAPAISSKQMNDKIVATYYTIVNGIKYKSAEDTFNLVSYYNANKDLVAKYPNYAAAYASLFELLETMFNYGSVAQLQFKYNTEQDPENPDYTGLVNLHIDLGKRMSTEKAYEALNISINADKVDGKDFTDETVYLDLVNLAADLAQEIALQPRFTTTEASGIKLNAENIKDLQFIGTYETVEKGVKLTKDICVSGEKILMATAGSYARGRVEARIDVVPAKDLRSTIVGYLADAEGNRVSETVEISFEAYATAQMEAIKNNANYANLRTMLYATLQYADQATEYFESR